jgi:hypothetical protein
MKAFTRSSNRFDGHLVLGEVIPEQPELSVHLLAQEVTSDLEANLGVCGEYLSSAEGGLVSARLPRRRDDPPIA